MTRLSRQFLIPTLAPPVAPVFNPRRMIVIRRLIDRDRAYTAIFLPGEPPRIFPTSDHEHGRILQIYKQDRRYPDVLNDFTDFDLGPPTSTRG